MTRAEFTSHLIARSDELRRKYLAHVEAGEIFAAEDMLPEVTFANRAAHEALTEGR